MGSRALPILIGAALLAGCGSSGGSATTRTASPAQARNVSIDERVRVDAAGTHFQPSLVAHSGQEVEFVTVLHHQRGQPVPVTLHLVQGAKGRITITAATPARTASATIESASQAPLYLVAVHYPCDLPPQPTFCPAAHVTSTGAGYQLQFAAQERTPLELYARLGTRPTGSNKKLRRATQSSVPPYKVVEAVGAVSGAQGAGAPLGSSAQVHPGDAVALETRLASPISGAPQPVSISFSRGPARSINVTASVPGHAPSTARLLGAAGAAITVGSGHFMCFLAPYPTFCPAQKATLGEAGYRLTFEATPNTSPIRIVVRIR